RSWRIAALGAALLATVRAVRAQDASIDRVLTTSQSRSMVFNGIFGEERTLISRKGDRASYVREWGLVRAPGSPGSSFSEAILVEIDKPFNVRRVRAARTVGPNNSIRDLLFADGRVKGTIASWRGKDTTTTMVDREMPAGTIDGSVYFPLLLSRYWKVG